MNIVKTGFFILLKDYKSNNAFINFCYDFYKDNFFIFILTRPLKVGLTRLNALRKITLKLGLYKPKDRQRSEVLEGIDIGNNGFKDLNS